MPYYVFPIHSIISEIFVKETGHQTGIHISAELSDENYLSQLVKFWPACQARSPSPDSPLILEDIKVPVKKANDKTSESDPIFVVI